MNLLALIIAIAILLLAVLLMGFKIFFSKGGEFPNIHIGGNKALADRGINCATTQDTDAQKDKIDLTSLLSELDK